MAFQRDKFTSFFNLIRTVQDSYPEYRYQAIAQNFILEERLTVEREDGYTHYVVSSQNLDEWKSGHEKYLDRKIWLDKGTPETFTNLNVPNLLTKREQVQSLVRVENLDSLLKLTESIADVTSLTDRISRFLENPKDQEAVALVEEFLSEWNGNRDLRPIFVGFWDDVKDIFDGNDEHWANKLRDRFGLGHFAPNPKEKSIPVLLLQYELTDVVAAQPDERNFAAIPTVLDTDMSHFFCPTPKSWDKGQTLDLGPGTANDYKFYYEILHRYIKYKPSYIYRLGWITEPPGKTCEEARRIHFDFLSGDFKHFELLNHD